MTNDAPHVTDVLDAIIDQVSNHSYLAEILCFGNSFEGWLKFELARGLCHRFELAPWDHSSQRGGVGVEYRYKSLPRDDESARRKLIDLWVGFEPTVYIELKVAFHRNNEGKQLRSWEADFAALHNVLEDEPDVAGFASVLMGVGFDDASWESALARASRRVEFHDHGIVIGGAVSLRMACLRAG